MLKKINLKLVGFIGVQRDEETRERRKGKGKRWRERKKEEGKEKKPELSPPFFGLEKQ
jgi:hypothetical protein